MCFSVNAVNQDVQCSVKLLKIIYLFAYAQAHSQISCVLLALQVSYDQPHNSYDQTHAPYDETHALYAPKCACNLLNLSSLLRFAGLRRNSYMEWFMVWITVTKRNAARHMTPNSGLVWYVLANKRTTCTWASS